MGSFREKCNDPPIPGRRVTLSVESTLASVYMRKKLTHLPEPTALAHALIASL